MQKRSQLSLKDYISGESCFDLQFRRDVRYDRPRRPVYYRWKAQFVIALNKNESDLLKEIKKSFGCGEISLTKKRSRFSVQDIDDLYNIIIPFFKTCKLSKKKEKDFKLWTKAVGIIYKNKGKNLADWKRRDFCKLIEIQNLMQRYKERIPQKFKWLSIAKSIAKTLKK